METVVESPLGNLHLVEENNQLTEVTFSTSPVTAEPENAILLLAKEQLEHYFAGTLTHFELPINPKGTDFQKKVWHELAQIPYGKTVSYQQVANQLGDPKCIRAAATANGKNPIAIIIPCHRVIGSNGEMTGYAGGIQKKKELLTLEGADVMSQLNLF